MIRSAGFAMKAASVGTKIISFVSVFLAANMIAYSGVVLYDTVYTNREAFVSSDLTQYRPVVTEEEPGFEELQAINTDTCAWLTLDGTHIDYPVVQGENDLEYSMKDVYGNSSLTGSIYLTSENSNDFTNSFNIVYGHHMDNGAMFGDIEKYDDPTYFSSHQDGILVTTHGVYDLHVFARLSADAYDMRVYSAGDIPASEVPDYLYYLKSLSVQWDESTDIEATAAGIQTYITAREQNISENGSFVFSKMPEDAVENGRQLIAFSTCMDATTNGRQVLVATMSFRTEPLPTELTIEDQQVPLAAWGHGQSEHWALLNLICLVMMIAVMLPGKAIVKKIRRIVGKDGDEEAAEDESALRMPRMIGAFAQILIAAAALILFIRTENMTKPMVVVDKWTLLMIVLYAMMWAIDVFVIRYAKRRADAQADEQKKPDGGAASGAIKTSFTEA